MLNTDKTVCRMLVSLLAEHGVRHVVGSPGSRNAPLLVAVNRHPGLQLHMVVDERSAGFIALGIAAKSREMVALICTSGTALLNYAPAVAEAFYRELPLIVVSADRPACWIDQDDSQTIHQDGALANFVKFSCNIPSWEGSDADAEWFANRKINDALIAASSGERLPVHINIQLDTPLGRLVEVGQESARMIRSMQSGGFESVPDELVRDISSLPRVLIIAGFMEPQPSVSNALSELARFGNVAVMHEAQANLKDSDDRFIPAIDATLTLLSEAQLRELKPDLVITIGGSLVSRFVKNYLRRCHPSRHWHIGEQDHSVDCFRALTLRIKSRPVDILPLLAEQVDLLHSTHASNYADLWRQARDEARNYVKEFCQKAPWSDFAAMAKLVSLVPNGWNVHLSNGTPIRYIQLFDYSQISFTDCNRGVSGIDGCTSTAIGIQTVSEETTLLITGDMSARYDVGALGCSLITPRFKMVVLNNAGGGIFRFVDSTRNLPEREDLFAVDVNLPLRGLAAAYGFAYFEASDLASLESVFTAFAAESERPAILNVVTPPQVSADTLNSFFKNRI